jgi:hypothetical protein
MMQFNHFSLLTPSIVYLELIGEQDMMNGKRWEQFITVSLLQLDRFEFYFNELEFTVQIQTYFNSILLAWVAEVCGAGNFHAPRAPPRAFYLHLPVRTRGPAFKTNPLVPCRKFSSTPPAPLRPVNFSFIIEFYFLFIILKYITSFFNKKIQD